MKATEAMAIRQQVADWRTRAKVLHETDAGTPAESLTLEACAEELETLWQQLALDDIADRERFER